MLASQNLRPNNQAVREKSDLTSKIVILNHDDTTNTTLDTKPIFDSVF